MTDYAKKTVADLTEILKSRGLPHSGKKADLVARLVEADKAAETTSAPEPTTAPASEPTAELPPPSDTSTAVPTAPAPSAPTTATHQADPSTEPTDAPTPDTALAAATYKLDLPTSSVDDELKKRQARAARFGIAVDEKTDAKDTEAQRALERAKRFGTGEKAIGKLDEALPVAREKGERKRGAEASAMDDPGLKGRGGGGGGKRFRGGGGGGGGGRGGRPGAGERQNSNRGDRPSGVAKTQPAYVSDKDRAAAEARKKKFAATA